MPNGGSDCCGTCPFNGVSKGKAQYPPNDNRNFYCEIRKFPIKNPFRTYCNNHPRRNPLWSRIARGPIWTSLYVSYDRKPMSSEIKIPPELVPPLGDGSYSRIPYYRFERPVPDKSGKCEICSEECTETISILVEKEKVHFCSVAHYFEWWLRSDPIALSFKKKHLLDQDEIREKFQTIAEQLPRYADVDKESRLKALREIDELLIASRFGQIDLMHVSLYLEHPEFRHPKLQKKISPHLLRVLAELAETARLIRKNVPDEDGEIYSRMLRIAASIQGFLSQEEKARKEIVKEFLKKLNPRSAADALERIMDEKMEEYIVKRLELKKNLVVCLYPTEERQRITCVNAKDKEKIGTYFDVVSNYHLYLVNNTNHDIRLENAGLIPTKDFYLIEEYPFWMFDWSNCYSLRICVADAVWFKLMVTINKGGPDERKIRMIPGLNKKAYNLKYQLE